MCGGAGHHGLLRRIHLTDTHILPAGETNYGLDPTERLRAAVESIAARHGPYGAAPAEFVIITGDLTHHGQPEAYAELRRILDGLPMAFHLMLGNHDERAHFRTAFPEAPTDEGGFIGRRSKPMSVCFFCSIPRPRAPMPGRCARVAWPG